MNLQRILPIFLASFLFSLCTAAQQAPLVVIPLQRENPPRDSQVVAILAQSVTAMGGVVPSDSLATGTIDIVAGSKTEKGTIRLLTRGLDQTAEQIVTPEATRAVIYSHDQAIEIEGNSAKAQQLELVVTSQSPCFPLVLLAAALNDPDTAFEYLGEETLGGSVVHRIRFWNSFASKPRLRHLAEFSVKDVWVDAASGLPRKLSYDRRAASGAEARVPVEVFFSNYRNVGGVLYPFQIHKWLNGTPWATVIIDSVALNSGLTDADFPVR